MISGKRERCAAVLDRVGARQLLLANSWRGLLVFNYHRIGRAEDSPWDRALWSADVETFAAQVTFLKRHFDLVGPDDLDSLLNDRRSRGVMITFDDGYRNNFELALPVLRAEAATATFFITSGFLDDRAVTWWDDIAWMVHTSRRSVIPPGQWTAEPFELAQDREPVILRLVRTYKLLSDSESEVFLDWLGEVTGQGRCPVGAANEMWMTWDMVREMDRAGMSIGGHTVTHPVLANCSAEKQHWEVEVSKERIEAELGHPITAFSYPVGKEHCFDAVTKAIVREAGYYWAFSFIGGYAHPAGFDRFALPRMAVSQHVSGALFRCTAAVPQLFAL